MLAEPNSKAELLNYTEVTKTNREKYVRLFIIGVLEVLDPGGRVGARLNMLEIDKLEALEGMKGCIIDQWYHSIIAATTQLALIGLGVSL